MRKRSNYYVMECLWWDTDTYIALLFKSNICTIITDTTARAHNLTVKVTHIFNIIYQGGFISSEWLNKPEPVFDKLKNVSLRKYMPWIHYWGGWPLFQEMLNTLDVIAKKHSVSISNVAVRLWRYQSTITLIWLIRSGVETPFVFTQMVLLMLFRC